MLAEDMAPNRLTRAKLAALDLKRLAKTDRVALIAFGAIAGMSFLSSNINVAFSRIATTLTSAA